MDEIDFGKVGVLYGGTSAEREVSLKSGGMVLEALKRQGVNAHAFDTGARGLVELAAEKFDRAFIALHGRFGEDGAMQGVLELLRIPYTGSGVMASSVAMDKVLTKRIWEGAGLSTPISVALTADSDLSGVTTDLQLPLFVKPPHEGSSIGVTKVTEENQLAAAVALALQCDTCALAEQFIDGRELTVAILGEGMQARALPIIEIIAPGGNYDYQNKYIGNATQYVCPAALDSELTEAIQHLALQAYRALDCSGWGRVDVMLRARDDKPFLLEVNTSPGMTDHSLVPMAARAAGITYDALVLEILKMASLKIAASGARA
ncbi:MAG: D-alanine--D-alanine ligase [Burkholderiaceae bacterium]|nr:MAG: D-alanine--D-alanine ligase [Burkholderiaceae bacterium]